MTSGVHFATLQKDFQPPVCLTCDSYDEEVMNGLCSRTIETQHNGNDISTLICFCAKSCHAL
jgi:hypothetical protein